LEPSLLLHLKGHSLNPLFLEIYLGKDDDV